jgi:hypothetical protein
MSKQTDLINIPDAITVDSSGIVNLDSTFSSGTTGGIIRLKDAGTQFGDLNEDSGNFLIASAQVDKDIIFKGNDGGGIITAMTIDMSAGGNVGIGTSSPAGVLHANSSGHTKTYITSGTSNDAQINFGDSDDNDIGGIHYDNAQNSMKFLTNTSQRLRIDSDGLKFHGDTAAANALNDYEEGTWTPADGSGQGLTIASATGMYTKVGRIVTATAAFTYPSNSDNNYAIIQGLPFYASNTSDAEYAPGSIQTSYISATNRHLAPLVYRNTNKFYFYDSENPLTNGNISAKNFRVTVVYYTAS